MKMINFQQSDVAQDGPNVKAKGEGGVYVYVLFFPFWFTGDS